MSTKKTLKDLLCNANPASSSKEDENDNYSRIFLLDGGVSTHLRDLCQHDFDPVSLWSSSLLMTPKGRATILQGHKDWLASGSDILTTVTYQCHTFSKSIDEKQMKQMLKDGVDLAHQAIEESEKAEEADGKKKRRPKYLVASMGCYGAALNDGSEYTGNYPLIKSEDDLIDFHKKKTKYLLQQKQMDGIALETVPCAQECHAFVKLLEQLKGKKKSASFPACWISLACKNGDQLNDGSPIEDALQAIHELDPEAKLVQGIGINCCDSEHIQSLAKRMTLFLAKAHSKATKKASATPNHTTITRAIAIYPNSGEEWNGQTHTWKEGTGLRAEELQDVFATRLLEAVDMIHRTWKDHFSSSQTLPPPPSILLGGCCRTLPGSIQSLRDLLDQRQQHESEAPIAETEEDEEEDEDELLATAANWAEQESDFSEEAKPSSGGEEEGSDRASKRQKRAPETATENIIDDKKKKNDFSLHITQLPYDTTDYDIRDFFIKKGCLLKSVRLVYSSDKNKATGVKKGSKEPVGPKFSGVCFIDCLDEASYNIALGLHRTSFGGRRYVHAHEVDASFNAQIVVVLCSHLLSSISFWKDQRSAHAKQRRN